MLEAFDTKITFLTYFNPCAVLNRQSGLRLFVSLQPWLNIPSNIPRYESEDKCKVLIMKISFHSFANKTNFRMKSFALSLSFVMRFIASRKWPFYSSVYFSSVQVSTTGRMVTLTTDFSWRSGKETWEERWKWQLTANS